MSVYDLTAQTYARIPPVTSNGVVASNQTVDVQRNVASSTAKIVKLQNGLTTATQIAPSNDVARRVVVSNNGYSPVYLGGYNSAWGDGYKLSPGGTVEFTTSDAIYATTPPKRSFPYSTVRQPIPEAILVVTEGI